VLVIPLAALPATGRRSRSEGIQVTRAD